MEVRRSVLVPHSAEAMFDLIEQAEHYPQFLPWCVGATILERSDDWVAAQVDFSYAQVHFSLRTRNAKRRPEWLRVRVVDGPFRRFDGDWRLTPLGHLGCKVEFEVDYELSAAIVDRLARPTVELVARSVVEAFVKRAELVCGAAS
jgi:ribosome-associated toxin RatA of RatAB toxin-antitoxin module